MSKEINNQRIKQWKGIFQNKFSVLKKGTKVESKETYTDWWPCNTVDPERSKWRMFYQLLAKTKRWVTKVQLHYIILKRRKGLKRIIKRFYRR